jgi:hypothetical protein
LPKWFALTVDWAPPIGFRCGVCCNTGLIVRTRFDKLCCLYGCVRKGGTRETSFPVKLKQNRRAVLLSGAISGTISGYGTNRENPGEDAPGAGKLGFNDFKKVCESYFGKHRQDGSSHAIFKTPWPGDPRVNIQNAKGKA